MMQLSHQVALTLIRQAVQPERRWVRKEQMLLRSLQGSRNLPAAHSRRAQLTLVLTLLRAHSKHCVDSTLTSFR